MRKPVLIVIAGPNGSGKTSTTRLVIKHEWAEQCVYINPDEIAQSKFGDWNDVCGYEYNPSETGKAFNELPEDWTCPICGVGKDQFSEA